ncbi:MAG: hypothetical protein DRP85_05320 [Candidatus Makaraimicrobium thalassicum]|nr:MAG: hypothetical protein DRP85_05320 [Candidatus Omnitrophota bacterium]
MRIGGILFGTAVVFAAVCCFAGENEPAAGYVSPERLFSRGNDHYEKAEYGKAIDEYEKIPALGYESASLYYNMAGAYFKAGRLGKAILNYARAKRIMPRDADITANDKFARAMVKGEVIPEKGIWTWRPVRIYSRSFTVDELTWLSSGLYVLIIVLLFIAVIRSDTNWYRLTGIVLLFVFILFNSAVIWHKAGSMRRDGITVVPRAEALFGPFDSATKFFTLNEGMRVTVIKAKDDWYKVRRADGKVGWVRKAEIEKI